MHTSVSAKPECAVPLLHRREVSCEAYMASVLIVTVRIDPTLQSTELACAMNKAFILRWRTPDDDTVIPWRN